MSLKKGLVGFGLSASIIAGGAFSLVEWHQERVNADTELACAAPKDVGNIVCRNVITTKAAVADTADFSDILAVAGLVGIVGGGLAASTSFKEVMKEDRKEKAAAPAAIQSAVET